MTYQSTTRFNVYEAITNQIIAAVEAGPGKVQMPWHRSGAALSRPINVSSNKPYRGVNTISLWAAAEHAAYRHGLWGTYRQWHEAGAQVRKGEQSSLIVFYKQFDTEEGNADQDQPTRWSCMARASRVFNVAQVDGYTLPEPEASDNRVHPIASAEAFVAKTGAIINEGGERAYYSPTDDQITMPDRHRFHDTSTSSATESWFSVLLHELTHWSGSSHRLDRQFGKRFGDKAYCIEELTAELGAAFLCADLHICAEPRPDHACYINNWLSVMKSDSRAIFAAASAASKAVDYLTLPSLS